MDITYTRVDDPVGVDPDPTLEKNPESGTERQETWTRITPFINKPESDIIKLTNSFI